jgi:hypothetical protein
VCEDVEEKGLATEKEGRRERRREEGRVRMGWFDGWRERENEAVEVRGCP